MFEYDEPQSGSPKARAMVSGKPQVKTFSVRRPSAKAKPLQTTWGTTTAMVDAVNPSGAEAVALAALSLPLPGRGNGHPDSVGDPLRDRTWDGSIDLSREQDSKWQCPPVLETEQEVMISD